jgi:hypothetical protein
LGTFLISRSAVENIHTYILFMHCKFVNTRTVL